MPAPIDGILLIDHGSRLALSNEQTEKIGAMLSIRQHCPVVTAHMELASPDIERGFADLAASGVRHITVIPLFIADGKHLQQDIPELLDLAASKHGLAFTLQGPLADDPGFEDYLNSRIQQAVETQY